MPAMNRRLQGILINSTICCVTFLSTFTYGATTVAIPTIGKDLNFKQGDLQWPLNVYSLSFGCLLLLCGRIADIIGSKRMFIVGSAWFGIWCLAASFAPNAPIFIVFNALQGIGSGISIISSFHLAGKDKNQAFAILGAGQYIGFIAGEIMGGVLSQSKASWRTIFWLQAGLGFVLCVAGWFVFPADDKSQRYDKGLDWLGAITSTCGLGLLVYSLAESTTARNGWATPFVPTLFSIALILLVAFVFWEIRREARGQSVLLPMSMWLQPGAKMGPTILLVLLGWWGFNTLVYYVPLYYQEVLFLSPLKTALWLVPMGISGLLTNLITGYLVAIVPSQLLLIAGIAPCMGACIIFALIDIRASYWAMAFIINMMCPVLDVAYTVANIQVCSAFDSKSQALAGSIFSVATRLGTSLGLAVTSSIAHAVSQKYNNKHPDLSAMDPAVLMTGFRAAGWACAAVLALSLLIAVVWVRGIGFVGQPLVVTGAAHDSTCTVQSVDDGLSPEKIERSGASSFVGSENTQTAAQALADIEIQTEKNVADVV